VRSRATVDLSSYRSSSYDGSIHNQGKGLARQPVADTLEAIGGIED
jgi:hypothetical protein